MSLPEPRDTYAMNRGQDDQDRLVRMAHGPLAEFAREACVRAGLALGGRAIDVGCGPLGAMHILADIVGPTGGVIGLDSSPTALTTARRVLDGLGLARVRLVRADLTTIDPAALAALGPVDLAFSRAFLMHQADPAHALRQIARLVRPGGRIVAQDPLMADARYPSYDPPVPALEAVMALGYETAARSGATPDVARRYRELCAAAGLRVVAQRGLFYLPDDPREPLRLWRDTLHNFRERAVAFGLATDAEIDRLLAELDGVPTDQVRWCASHLRVELIAETPGSPLYEA